MRVTSVKEIKRTFILILLLASVAFAQERICNEPDCPDQMTNEQKDARVSSKSIKESEAYPEDDSKNENAERTIVEQGKREEID